MSAVKWKINAMRYLFFYSFDCAIAIGGWTWGFGLHVTNWWALISLLIFSRFVLHTLNWAYMVRDAEAAAKGKAS